MKFVRIAIGASLIFCIIFTVLIGRNKLRENYEYTEPQEYKGIITIWQIDGFEGGAGSRKQFLLKVAREFEKENDGVLVMVMDQTLKGATENIKSGKIPDIISYSNGLEVTEVLTKINPSQKTKACQIKH